MGLNVSQFKSNMYDLVNTIYVYVVSDCVPGGGNPTDCKKCCQKMMQRVHQGDF